MVTAASHLGRTHPKLLKLRVQQAEELFEQEREDEGFAALDALVGDCMADLGPHHDTTLVLANNRAMKLAERSRPGGMEQLAALVPVAIQVWGLQDRRTVLLRSNLAAATGMAGRFADAIAQIEALLAEGNALDADVVGTLRTNLASWRKRHEA